MPGNAVTIPLPCYAGDKCMEPRARVELATCRLRIGCSTTELPRLGKTSVILSRGVRFISVHPSTARRSMDVASSEFFGQRPHDEGESGSVSDTGVA